MLVRMTLCLSLGVTVLVGVRLIWHWLGTGRQWSLVTGVWPLASVLCTPEPRWLWLLSAWLRLRLWSIPSSECLLWLWPPSQNLQCYNPLSTDTRHRGRWPDQSFSQTFVSILILLHSGVWMLIFVSEYTENGNGYVISRSCSYAIQSSLILINQVFIMTKCLEQKVRK